MLDKLRNFSKSKIAGVLVAIIIVPFVFWGMGSVFSGGNTNSVAKINNYNVSTKDFIEYINNSKINPEFIKENLENNILEQLLTQLISVRLIDIEVKELNIEISDKVLANRIKMQEAFLDDNKKFSRLKYEKFLLKNNYSVIEFENSIRKNEQKKKLFKYISGGIKSPYFIANKNYKAQNKEIELLFFNLNNIYKKKDEFNDNEIINYIKKNEEKLKKEIIDISYVKITPEVITEQEEFNENFFKVIDEIENLVLKGTKLNEISNKYSLDLININEYPDSNINYEEFVNEIYEKRNENKIQLLDKNDFFLLYEISNLKKVLPDVDDVNFIKNVKNDIFETHKYEFNKKILTQIDENKFLNSDFENLTKGYQINKTTITSNKDTTKFNLDSINLIYSLKNNTFSLIVDNNNDIYLAKIQNIQEKNLQKADKEYLNLIKESDSIIKSNLYSSYDYLLNDKYKIKVNQKSLERIKNYFR
tara:strand:+ start:41 stop:1468 length:1428 start_codon:yes stop_codon:yes gene_type:complete